MFTNSLDEGRFHLATNHSNSTKGRLVNWEVITNNPAYFVGNDLKPNAGDTDILSTRGGGKV